MDNSYDTGDSKMPEQTISIGQRIFNHGDMANVPHWGSIIAVNTSQDWGNSYVIKTDDEKDTYTIRAAQLGHVYKGNGLTRIVTEEAYNAWRHKKLVELNRRPVGPRVLELDQEEA